MTEPPARVAHTAGSGAASLRRSQDLIPTLVLLTIFAVAAVALGLARLGADVAILAASSTGLLFLFAITRLPTNDQVWRLGADDHVQTSLLLQPLEADGWVVLDDRRAPSSRATVDHLAIGPSGVWVVQTIAWQGRLRIQGDETWLDGERSLAVDQALRTAAAIQLAASKELAGLGVAVRPVLCFHRARLPLLRRDVRGVALTDGRRLVRLLSSPPPVMDEDAVRTVAALLDGALIPQVRASGK